MVTSLLCRAFRCLFVWPFNCRFMGSQSHAMFAWCVCVGVCVCVCASQTANQPTLNRPIIEHICTYTHVHCMPMIWWLYYTPRSFLFIVFFSFHSHQIAYALINNNLPSSVHINSANVHINFLHWDRQQQRWKNENKFVYIPYMQRYGIYHHIWMKSTTKMHVHMLNIYIIHLSFLLVLSSYVYIDIDIYTYLFIYDMICLEFGCMMI